MKAVADTSGRKKPSRRVAEIEMIKSKLQETAVKAGPHESEPDRQQSPRGAQTDSSANKR